jgi:hypothetical protein
MLRLPVELSTGVTLGLIYLFIASLTMLLVGLAAVHMDRSRALIAQCFRVLHVRSAVGNKRQGKSNIYIVQCCRLF